MIAVLSSKAGVPTQSSFPSPSNTSYVHTIARSHIWRAPNFAASSSFLTCYGRLAPAQRLTLFMIRCWSREHWLSVPTEKVGTLAGFGWRYCEDTFQALELAGVLNRELTSRISPTPPLSQYMAVKTFYVDISSRFTAPHCLSYYQAINSAAGMNWLTSRVAGVASCNLIPYIILSVSLPHPHPLPFIH